MRKQVECWFRRIVANRFLTYRPILYATAMQTVTLLFCSKKAISRSPTTYPGYVSIPINL